MTKRIAAGVTILFILLGVGATAFLFPSTANRGIDFVNRHISQIAEGVSIPSIPDVPFQLGLDLQGGLRLVYEADLSDVSPGEYESRMRGIRDIIESRVNVFGVREPIVQIQGSGSDQRLVVELPGVTELDQVNELLKEHPVLEFRELREEPETITPENGEITIEDPFVSTSLHGGHLGRANWQLDQFTSSPMVTLEFNEEGARLFEEITARNIGQPLAIYIDGEPVQVATVQARIAGGRAQITGIESVQEAQYIARNLNAGALPVDISLVSSRAVGPTLGAESLEDSLVAGLWGFAAVVVFLVVIYRFLGIVAALTLVLYGLVLLLLFKSFGITLSLAGIAGFILSIGMAVDANILIFSRMREELQGGRSFSAALTEGFRRAWPSIRDGNLTTLLVMLILFLAGSSFVQGFALTLSLGLVLSMITAMVATRAILELISRTKLSHIKALWA